MPKKICNFMGCHNLIDYSEVYCEEHKTESAQRHKTYDLFRRNKKSADFYHSVEWIKTREVVLIKFSHIDIYAYYVEHKIIAAKTIHHIVELDDEWNKRLCLDNLIPVSDGSHNKIHAAYKESKESKANMQKLLMKLKSKWINEFTYK